MIGPGHSLRVGQYWDVTGCKQVEKKPVDVRRKEMMRGLNEDVPAVVDAKHNARPQFTNQIRCDMRIATDDQTTVDARSVQLRLERFHAASDIGP